MYLRPRSIYEKLQIEEKITRLNETGRQVVEFKPTGEEILGVVSTAEPADREKFKGLKHEVSHVIIQHLSRLKAKVGDRLIKGDKIYYVEATDEPAGFGQWYLYWCSERYDTK